MTETNLSQKGKPLTRNSPRAKALKEELLLKQNILIKKARYDFKTFIALIKTNYIFEWGHELIIEELNKLIFGEINRLMIFAPPRFGKTELSSKLLPAFILGVFSSLLIKNNGDPFNIMAGSYTEDLAKKVSQDIQKYMESEIYKRIFPQIRIAPKGGRFGSQFTRSVLDFDVLADINPSSSKKKVWFYDNKLNGEPPIIKKVANYKITFPGGVATGLGYNVGLLDDMVKNPKDVESQLQRNSVYNWYEAVFDTRKETFGKMQPKQLILMTRWHHDDLPGRLLEDSKQADRLNKWTVVRLPAEAYAEKDILRHPKDHRKKGQLLSKRNMSTSKIQNLKRKKGGFYEALYQQRPTSTKGFMVKRSWLKFYTQEEVSKMHFHSLFGGVDLSFDSLEEGSKCVLMRCGVVYNPLKVYILDLIRDDMDYVEQKEAIKAFYEKHKQWTDSIFIESAANARAVMSELGASDKKFKSKEEYIKLTKEIPVLELVTVKDSKTVRLKSVLGYFKFGNVYLPKKEEQSWAEEYIEELLQFPKGKYNDQVDATSLCLNKVKEWEINMETNKMWSM